MPVTDTPKPGPAAPPGPPAAPAGPTRRPAHGRRWRVGGWLLAIAALLIAAPVLTLLALWHADTTLPWGLGQVPGLSTQGVRGSLAGGQLEIDQLDYALPGNTGHLQLRGLRLQGLRWSWGTRPTLHIALLRARQLSYRSGAASTAAPAAPTDLHLPISLAIASLQVDSSQINDLPPLRDLQARVALGADGGALHRIDDLRVDWEQARLTGELRLGAGGTLPLQARLQASALGARPWQAQAQADGPLARFALKLAAEGEAREGHPAPSVKAEATITVFAGWPLATLSLTTRQLDLAALSAHLPQTALTGSAEVQSSGLNRTASARIQLDNAQPGRFDEARLPVRRLLMTLAGEPRHTDRLDLQQFELLLADGRGPAGTLRGSGRWQGERLDLALQLDGMQPARLDARAAPIRLSGPLTLKVSDLPVAASAAQPAGVPTPVSPGAPVSAGPHLSLQGQLSGQALDGSGGPVQLKLSLEGDAQRWQLHQAEASTGTAHLRASGDARREAAGWRISAQTELARFDPLPWWRGDAESPWRRGPHRLNGQATAKLLWLDPAVANTRSPSVAKPATAASASAAGPPVTPTPPAKPGTPAAPGTLPRWLQAITGELQLTLADSQLAGVPVAGHLALARSASAIKIDARLQAAGNRFSTEAQLSPDGGHQRGQLQVGAPALAELAPLRRLLAEVLPDAAPWLPSAGALEAQAELEGRWPAWRSNGTLSARGLRSPQATLVSADMSWTSSDSAEQPLALKLDARGLRIGSSVSGAGPVAPPGTTPGTTAPGSPAAATPANLAQQLDRLELSLGGSLARHTLHLVADSPLKPPGWTESLLGPTGNGSRFEAELRGEWQAQAGGSRWRLESLTLRGGARDAPAGASRWLTASDLSGTLELDRQVNPVALTFAAGRVQLLDAALRWRDVRWQAAAATAPAASTLTLSAELESIDVASWLKRLQPTLGWSGDLSISGRIDIRVAERVDADIVLERTAGDLAITDDLGTRQALGLTDLRLALGVHDGLWQFAQGLAGRHVGEIAGAQVIRSTPERRWPAPDAPMQGVLQARVANLGIWGAWVPPGWRLAGNLQTTASLGGKFNAPELRGEMRGSGLGVRNLLQGVNLSEGELAITLSGEQAQIERFSFRGGDGRLTVTGGATLGDTPALKLRLDADHFRLLGRLDRRVVTSGQVDVRLAPARLQVDGQIQVDEGLIDLSRADAPALDSDVQVHRNGSAALPGAAASAPATPPPPTWRGSAEVAVRVNLGDKLQLRGRGIDTGLTGDLRITSPGNKLALNGSVRTRGGTYAAYGQKLEITRGELSFLGAMDNPRLDVLAVRPNLDVVVGVSVVGTAQNPRIRLTSEPEMAEFDKLSWLVLGRSPDGLGRTDTALLQRAAVALLAGGQGRAPTDALIESLGLTDFSLRQTEGDVRETIVSLGRQLSRRWYVGYERSVNATTGTWQLIYRVAQRFTLRAQSGGENSVDLIWSWRW